MKVLKFIALILIFTACEKQLTLRLDDFDKKLVVNAFANNTSALSINLGENSPILEEPTLESDIAEARIILFENDFLIYDKQLSLNKGLVETSNFLQMDKEYELIIDVEGYPVVTAKDKMPNTIPKLEITDIFSIGESVHMRVNVEDDGGDDQYMLLMNMRGYTVSNGDTIYGYRTQNFTSSDKLFISNINSIRANTHFTFFDDALLNSGTRSIELMIDKADTYTKAGFTPTAVRIELRSLSKSFFDYYLELIENNHIYGGPLASSSYFKGNIEGGLGIFGCYTSEDDHISLP